MTNFQYGVASYGMPLIGSGPYVTTGKVFFVHYTTGVDGVGRGDAPDRPFKTLDFAIGQCRANKGDIIFLMPGHAEDITAAGTVTADVNGISIVGLGNGRLRPTFTFKTAVGATFLLSGSHILVTNIFFDMTGINAITTGLSLTGDDNVIVGNEFKMAAAGPLVAVQAITVASGADRNTIRGCYFDAFGTAGATAAIQGSAAADRLEIDSNVFYGDFATSAILNDTAAWTRVLINNNRYVGTNASEPMIELHASASGMISNNKSGVATMATNGFHVADGAYKVENYGTDTLAAAASSGILDPVGVTL